jgi:N-acyl homoserine lactone hydrolase
LKVYLLDNGHLEFDANILVNFTTIANARNKAPTHQWIKAPVYQVLIDHPQGRILFDTGCAPDSMQGKWPPHVAMMTTYTYTEEQRLDRQLKKIGFEPKEIGTVILSHFHMDHAGNLDMFPHADVHVNREEYAMALVESHSGSGGYIRYEVDVPCKFKLFTEDFELVPGVKIINLPGHTIGHAGIMVSLPNTGNLIFPMDALYSRANYGPPARIAGGVYDSLGFFKSIEKVRKLEKDFQAKVMFSHDVEFAKTLKYAPEYYD